MEPEEMMGRSGFGTKAVHAGQAPDVATGSIIPPVYLTSTYVQQAPGRHCGYEYGRVSNPTRTALELNLAALEGAQFCCAFASGMAGADAILKSLRPGDHLIASSDLYGGNYRLFREVYGPFGIASDFVDATDVDVVEAALRPNSRLLWLETPTNPLTRIVDIGKLCLLAHAYDVDVVVDNTFATPYLQQPLQMGADLVLHSTTKYLGGHSDIIGGAVCTGRADWAERLSYQVKCAGAVPGPLDCYLVLRGTKTLHVRMDRHCRNARRIASYLETHPKVGRVHYPGLPSNPGYALARQQMRDFGGMISFQLNSDRIDQALQVLSDTRLFALAESLGGVESLIGHPASMTHASIPAEERRAAGLSDSLIRLSVGIEDVEDLIHDLERSLSKV